MDNTASKTVKRKSSEVERSDSVESTNKAKKIVLNRHLSEDTEQAITVPDVSTNGKTERKQVVKFSELSAKEVLTKLI